MTIVNSLMKRRRRSQKPRLKNAQQKAPTKKSRLLFDEAIVPRRPLSWRSIFGGIAVQGSLAVIIFGVPLLFTSGDEVRRNVSSELTMAATVVAPYFPPPRPRTPRPPSKAVLGKTNLLKLDKQTLEMPLPEEPEIELRKSVHLSADKQPSVPTRAAESVEAPMLSLSPSDPSSSLQLASTMGPKKPKEDVHIVGFGQEATSSQVGSENRDGLGRVVSRTGFFDPGSGQGASKQAGGSGRGNGGSFDPAVVKTTRRQPSTSSNSREKPVQIQYKPTPQYTQEARTKNIEGDVVLDVTFDVDGSVSINRVVKSLGYGLDESAKVAAKKIKFSPAIVDGLPTSFNTLIHINFQLAS